MYLYLRLVQYPTNKYYGCYNYVIILAQLCAHEVVSIHPFMWEKLNTTASALISLHFQLYLIRHDC